MKRKGIHRQFFFYFSMFAIIPLILFVGIAVVYIFFNEISEKRELLLAHMETTVEKLEEKMRKMGQIEERIEQDREWRVLLQDSEAVKEKFYGEQLLKNAQLMELVRSYDLEVTLYLLGENGIVLKSTEGAVKEQDFREDTWYRELEGRQETCWYGIREESFVGKDTNVKYLVVGTPLRNQNGDFLGCILMELNVEPIFWTMIDSDMEQAYLIETYTSAQNEEGQIMLYQNDRTIDIQNGFREYEKLSDMPDYMVSTIDEITYWKHNFPQAGVVRKDSYYVSYRQMAEHNWILVSTVEKAVLYREIYGILYIALIILLLLAAFVFVISGRVAKIVSKPVLDLQQMVHRVQKGDFEARVEQIGNDEIGDLGDSFNKMVIDIRNLMNEIREEQTKLRKYELMLLQAQINPHFLYNTLGSLEWLIRLNRPADAIKMTNALTAFFATGLNHGQDIISISEEIKNVESYLTIQQFRYPSKLHFKIYQDERIGKTKIPKLILQPFVENAIYHGIKEQEAGGLIEVRTYREGKKIVLMVTDNGHGMKEQELEALRKSILDADGNETDSYGIKNVFERLKLFYGEGVEFSINSRENRGTTVVIGLQEENIRYAEIGNCG